ncbi:M48 family metalloprotease [Gilvimarinus sp. F26214L]|uniref:M48 family metalloprotease n=1 Tax=Gilvimarinus sp. DZF01 TaxID=3461371 RepID=UPI004045D883
MEPGVASGLQRAWILAPLLLYQDEPLVFTLGWWRARIYVSRGLVSSCRKTELDIVFAHEGGHERRRDNRRMVAAQLGLLPLGLGPFKTGYA